LPIRGVAMLQIIWATGNETVSLVAETQLFYFSNNGVA